MLDDHAHVMQVKLCKANTWGVTEVAELAYNFFYAVQLQILFVHISDIRSHIILEQGQRLS